MFARPHAILAALALGPILAVANNPTVTVTVTAPGPTVTAADQCNTGNLMCCQSTQSVCSHPLNRSVFQSLFSRGFFIQVSNDSTGLVGILLALLGIVVSGDGLIGATCSPITVSPYISSSEVL